MMITPRSGSLLIGVLVFFGLNGSLGKTAQEGGAPGSLSSEILAMERSALDRWIGFDPEGYLGTYAPEVTYFDPNQEVRVGGLEVMQKLFAPIKRPKGDIYTRRYEMIAPKVQSHAGIALLTFNLITYGKAGEDPEIVLRRWNCTEVYCRFDGKWKIIHTHWSYTKPDIKKGDL